jgi:phosphoenolpyruvate carboxylase
MVMAKSDLALASRYAELVTDVQLAKTHLSRPLKPSGICTAQALQLITGAKQRLANNASLARSIKHRFPYIDPLHHLQVELIRRHRAGITDERARTRHPFVHQRHRSRPAQHGLEAVMARRCHCETLSF